MKHHNIIKLCLVMILLIIAGSWLWFAKHRNLSGNNIRNVLLVSIDTCRADHLSCYGYTRKTTPYIDAIANTGVMFTSVFSPVPQTLPAHSSMLTGTTPVYHGIHDNLGYKLDDSLTTLAEVFKKNGYKTGAVISSFVIDSQFGIDQGFDYYNDDFDDRINNPDVSERKGKEVSKYAIKWLEENNNERFFLFLHYFDPHFRYQPPEPFAQQYKNDPYAGEIAYADYCIGQVIEKLKQLDLFGSTLIVITGDHGEMLGEHGEAEHGFFIYQSAIKVPLIFKLPGKDQPHKIDSITGLVDLFPTICSIVDIPSPQPIHGKDLSNLILNKKDQTTDRFLYCESFTSTKHNANALLGVIAQDWKYIQTTRPELYDLKNDPKETTNIVDQKPQRTHLMREHLKLILQEHSAQSSVSSKLELDEEGKKRLESLGYIASANIKDRFEFDQNKPDPKDVIKFHNIKSCNEKATKLAQMGKLNEAEETLQQLIQHYENVPIKHDMATINANLAVVLKRIGKKQQAQEQFEKTVRLFKEELKKNPGSAQLWARLGNICATFGDFASASRAFKKTLELNPNDPAAYNNLAQSLYLNNQIGSAIEVLKKGIDYMAQTNQPQAAQWLNKRLESFNQ